MGGDAVHLAEDGDGVARGEGIGVFPLGRLQVLGEYGEEVENIILAGRAANPGQAFVALVVPETMSSAISDDIASMSPDPIAPMRAMTVSKLACVWSFMSCAPACVPRMVASVAPSEVVKRVLRFTSHTPWLAPQSSRGAFWHVLGSKRPPAGGPQASVALGEGPCQLRVFAKGKAVQVAGDDVDGLVEARPVLGLWRSGPIPPRPRAAHTGQREGQSAQSQVHVRPAPCGRNACRACPGSVSAFSVVKNVLAFMVSFLRVARNIYPRRIDRGIPRHRKS